MSYNDFFFNLSFFAYFIIFILGLSLGSFLSSWIWRLRENIRISRGRSICEICHRQLNWYENIPVVSYLFLRARCFVCKAKIPLQSTVIELATAFLFVFVTWYHTECFLTENSVGYITYYRDILFVSLLIVVFVYDYLYFIILSHVMWLGVFIGILFNVFFLDFSVLSLFIGIVIAGGFFLLQYLISGGRWIGGGDVRLGVIMGVWLGWPLILVALMVSYVLGAAGSLLLMIFKKRSLNSQTPFGTYLAIGTFIAIFWGQKITEWYLTLFK